MVALFLMIHSLAPGEKMKKYLILSCLIAALAVGCTKKEEGGAAAEEASTAPSDVAPAPEMEPKKEDARVVEEKEAPAPAPTPQE